MSIWQSLAGLFTRGRRVQALPSHDPGTWLFDPDLVRNLSPASLWSSQPHLRTVIEFRAENTAQLGLHVFERTDDGGRERDRTSALARLLAAPNDHTTMFELVFALVGDHDLYDRAYWLVAPDDSRPSGWTILRLPPAWVEPVRDETNPWRTAFYRVHGPGRVLDVPAELVVAFNGYAPGKIVGASSRVAALRDTLSEQMAAADFRRQIWDRGGRVSSVLRRPVDAPQWSDAAREAFRADWYAKYTGSGPMAGGTPILEDGMDLQRIDFSAADQQYVEAAKLSLETVAAAFHVPAAMVGMSNEASYSNMRAFRKMLYTESLGPLLKRIESRINQFLLPMLGMPDTTYVEFNIEQKLAGDFLEQASVLSTATGRPWMTANEARARQNMTALPGGDELVTPLNVLVGGQASPTDSGSQNVVPDPVQDQTPQ